MSLRRVTIGSRSFTIRPLTAAELDYAELNQRDARPLSPQSQRFHPDLVLSSGVVDASGRINDAEQATLVEKIVALSLKESVR